MSLNPIKKLWRRIKKYSKSLKHVLKDAKYVNIKFYND